MRISVGTTGTAGHTTSMIVTDQLLILVAIVCSVQHVSYCNRVVTITFYIAIVGSIQSYHIRSLWLHITHHSMSVHVYAHVHALVHTVVYTQACIEVYALVI